MDISTRFTRFYRLDVSILRWDLREVGNVGDCSRSLLQSLQHAQETTPIHFEWHVLDDASKDHPKTEMLNDLVQRKWLANYTRLPRHVGTVGALRHVVDTFLQREDLDLFLHCDDDILMGPTTLRRAVLDYAKLSKGFTQPGGVLALFVNSWCLDLLRPRTANQPGSDRHGTAARKLRSKDSPMLDEQLSFQAPAFGSFATAPFLGGASYLTDKATLRATGNPWEQAMKRKRRTPHEAHVLWLTEILPKEKLKIWIRWKIPYECQHLGNIPGENPELWDPAILGAHVGHRPWQQANRGGIPVPVQTRARGLVAEPSARLRVVSQFRGQGPWETLAVRLLLRLWVRSVSSTVGVHLKRIKHVESVDE
eukprot:Skav229783  [mRNA]  locus=scaffold684:66316:67777:- [translate_table: standard]